MRGHIYPLYYVSVVSLPHWRWGEGELKHLRVEQMVRADDVPSAWVSELVSAWVSVWVSVWVSAWASVWVGAWVGAYLVYGRVYG